MANKSSITLTKESQRLLKKFADSGDLDLRPSMKVIGGGYRKEIKAIFNKQQPRQEGLRWDPLSPAYATWKEIHFPNAGILVRTGTLKKSMTELGAEGNITLIGKTSGVFGSTIFYGVFHDEGRPERNLPQRNFSEPSDRRELIWRNQIERDIRRVFEKNGIEVKGSIFI